MRFQFTRFATANRRRSPTVPQSHATPSGIGTNHASAAQHRSSHRNHTPASRAIVRRRCRQGHRRHPRRQLIRSSVKVDRTRRGSIAVAGPIHRERRGDCGRACCLSYPCMASDLCTCEVWRLASLRSGGPDVGRCFVGRSEVADRFAKNWLADGTDRTRAHASAT